MNKILFVFIMGISSSFIVKAQIIIPDSIAPYVSFIDQQKLSSKDYIMEKSRTMTH